MRDSCDSKRGMITASKGGPCGRLSCLKKPVTAVYLNWGTILGGVSDLLLLTLDKRKMKDTTMRERTRKFLVTIEVIAGIWRTKRGTTHRLNGWS